VPVDPSQRPARTLRVVLAIFALGVLLRLPTFSRSMLSDDEAIYATTADALSRGDLLYRDVVDHKPPLIYHVYQLGFAIFGPYDTHGAHALVVLAVLLTAGFLMAMARRQAEVPSPSVGLAAAGLFLVFSTTWHDYDTLSANGELFLLAPQTAAGWLLLRALAPEDRGDDGPDDGRSPASSRGAAPQFVTHLLVGALIGVSALFKYQALTFLGASIGTVLWSALLGRIRAGHAALAISSHVVGAALPAALYLGGCAAAGNGAATIEWFRFNFSYVAAGLTGTEALARAVRRTAMIGGVAIVPYGLGIAGTVAVALAIGRFFRRGTLTSHGTKTAGATDTVPSLPPLTAVFGLLWLATAAVALSVGGRFFGHYFHLVLAPLCLLAAPGFHRLWNRGWSWRGPLLAASALPAAAFFFLATVGRPLAAAMDGSEPPYDQVAALIADVTTPDQRIFVWGNSPQLYVEARRPMGARFSFCNYMTGESPGTPTESGGRNADQNQHQPAWEMLFADLEQRRPALFVDAAAAGWDGYDKYPIARYPRLADYIDNHYRRLESRAGVVLYRRLR
jgi:hypothetical protein